MSRAEAKRQPATRWRTVRTPHHEPSVWLRGVCLDLAREAAGLGPPPAEGLIPLLPIHPAKPGTREDHTCDRCRRYDPHLVIHGFYYRPAANLAVYGGLCDDCARAEFGDLP